MSTPRLNISNILIAAIAPSATASAAVTTTPVRTDGRGIGSERFSAGKRVLASILRGGGGVAGTMAATLGTVALWGADLPNPMNARPLGNAFATAQTPNVNAFAGDGSTLTFQTDIPYAAWANNNFVVETMSFKLTGTFTVTAGGAITGSSTNFIPEIDVGDKVIIGGRVFEIATVTSDTAATVTAATAGTAVTAGAVGYSIEQSKFIKTYASSETGPQQYDVSDVGGFALITFAVAPPAPGPSPAIAGAQNSNVFIYKVTPVEILADGAHVNERVGIRSRTLLWLVYDGDSGDDLDSITATIEAQTAS